MGAQATPAPDDTLLSVPYPAIARKKVTAAFDGGRLSSDSGVMLLSLAERRRGIAKALAALIADPRDPAVTHRLASSPSPAAILLMKDKAKRPL
jgi:hypothetical protein